MWNKVTWHLLLFSGGQAWFNFTWCQSWCCWFRCCCSCSSPDGHPVVRVVGVVAEDSDIQLNPQPFAACRSQEGTRSYGASWKAWKTERKQIWSILWRTSTGTIQLLGAQLQEKSTRRSMVVTWWLRLRASRLSFQRCWRFLARLRPNKHHGLMGCLAGYQRYRLQFCKDDRGNAPCTMQHARTFPSKNWQEMIDQQNVEYSCTSNLLCCWRMARAVHLVHFDRTISGLFQNQATKMAWKIFRANELLLKFVAWSLPTYAWPRTLNFLRYIEVLCDLMRTLGDHLNWECDKHTTSEHLPFAAPKDSALLGECLWNQQRVAGHRVSLEL